MIQNPMFTIYLVWRSTYFSTFSSLKYTVHVITKLQSTTCKFTMVLDASAGDSQCFSREATPFYLNHADCWYTNYEL